MKIAVIGLGSIGRRHLGNFHTIGGVQLSARTTPSRRPREAAAKQFPFATDHPDAGGGARGCRRRGHRHAARLPPGAGPHGRRARRPRHDREAVDPDGRRRGGAAASDCDAKGLRVLTAYNWRYWPPMLLVEQLLKEGRIGAIRAGRTEYAYHLHAAPLPGRATTGSSTWPTPRRAAAACSTRATPSTTCAGCCGEITEVSAVVDRISSLEIDTDDIADLTVRFASGAVGNIHMNLFAWNVHSHFELMGEDGVHPVAALRERDPRSSIPRRIAGRSIPSAASSTTCTSRRREHFLAVHPRGGRRRACDGWDGLKTMRVIDAARQGVGRAALGEGLADGRDAVRLRRHSRARRLQGPARQEPASASGALSLIGHAVASRASRVQLTRFIVSTDSAEIAEEARRHGAEVPFLRPAELANDQAGMVPRAPARGALARGVGGRAARSHRDACSRPRRSAPAPRSTDDRRRWWRPAPTRPRRSCEASYHPFFMKTMEPDGPHGRAVPRRAKVRAPPGRARRLPALGRRLRHALPVAHERGADARRRQSRRRAWPSRPR